MLHRFCKPLDTELISRLAKEHSAMITVEESSIGGFGSHGVFSLSCPLLEFAKPFSFPQVSLTREHVFNLKGFCLIQFPCDARNYTNHSECVLHTRLAMSIELPSSWLPLPAVLTYLAQTGKLDGKCRVVPMTLPDRFIEHGSQADQLAEAGLSAADIARTALSLSGKSREAVLLEKF